MKAHGIAPPEPLDYVWEVVEGAAGIQIVVNGNAVAHAWGDTLCVNTDKLVAAGLSLDVSPTRNEPEPEYAPCGCPGSECIGECPSADFAVDAAREARAFGSTRMGRF